MRRAGIEGAQLTAASLTPAGPMSVPAAEWGAPKVVVPLPAFCRVTGVAGDLIGFEVWLPARGWNGRLLSVGNGGFGGSVRLDALADGLKAGYAVTSNDTGHRGDDRAWMGNPDQVRAWGHTATHIVTGPAKAIVSAYYARPVQRAYFTGCSTGGAQAMEEAQFYPKDYDGIVAGSPGMSYARLMLSFLWGLKVSGAYPDSPISVQKLVVLHQAVMADCGGASGARLGVLEDPQACHFNPAQIECHGDDRADCLSPHQVQTALALYQGPRNPRTGAQIYPGFAYGSESDVQIGAHNPLAYGWSGIQGPLARAFAIPLMRDMVYRDPDWDWRHFDWDHDVDEVERRVGKNIVATNADLGAFAAHGGRLIIYQGWGDPLNAQTQPIDYRAAVIDETAQTRRVDKSRATQDVDRFVGLFMAPGMAHCAGGPGPSQFDALNAVRAWVETDHAPEVLIATKPAQLERDGATSRAVTRPICRFPKVARWTGEGAGDLPAEFTCLAPAR